MNASGRAGCVLLWRGRTSIAVTRTQRFPIASDASVLRYHNLCDGRAATDPQSINSAPPRDDQAPGTSAGCSMTHHRVGIRIPYDLTSDVTVAGKPAAVRRSGERLRTCQLSVVDRKWPACGLTDANDPEPNSAHDVPEGRCTILELAVSRPSRFDSCVRVLVVTPRTYP